MRLKDRYDLVVFDLDGTLIDSRLDIATAANATLAEFGRPLLSHDTIISLVGSGVHQLLTDLFAASGEDIFGDRLEAAFHFFMQHYGDHCIDHTRFYPGVDACLRALADKKLAVLTNKPEALSHRILNELCHPSPFFPVIGGDHALGKKPEPHGLNFIMSTLTISPEKTLMVGDSGIDVATAKAAGCDSLVLLGGFGRETDLRHACPTWIVHDIEEFYSVL